MSLHKNIIFTTCIITLATSALIYSSNLQPAAPAAAVPGSRITVYVRPAPVSIPAAPASAPVTPSISGLASAFPPASPMSLTPVGLSRSSSGSSLSDARVSSSTSTTAASSNSSSLASTPMSSTSSNATPRENEATTMSGAWASVTSGSMTSTALAKKTLGIKLTEMSRAQLIAYAQRQQALIEQLQSNQSNFRRSSAGVPPIPSASMARAQAVATAALSSLAESSSAMGTTRMGSSSSRSHDSRRATPLPSPRDDNSAPGAQAAAVTGATHHDSRSFSPSSLGTGSAEPSPRTTGGMADSTDSIDGFSVLVAPVTPGTTAVHTSATQDNDSSSTNVSPASLNLSSNPHSTLVTPLTATPSTPTNVAVSPANTGLTAAQIQEWIEHREAAGIVFAGSGLNRTPTVRSHAGTYVFCAPVSRRAPDSCHTEAP